MSRDRCERIYESHKRTRLGLVMTYRCCLDKGHDGDHQMPAPVNFEFKRARERGW